MYGISHLSRKGKSVEAYTDYIPKESALYKPKADQVTFQSTTGDFCCVSRHIL